MGNIIKWLVGGGIALGLILILVVGGSWYKASLFVDEGWRERKMDSMRSEMEMDELGYEVMVEKCDVVVVGGGAGGVSAAIQAGRMGAKVCLVEETDWLGGMLSGAGVGAIDGRPDTPAGIFKEFLEGVRGYYERDGRLKETEQCAVSYFCYEPRVGDLVLKEMAGKVNDLKIYYNTELKKVYREGDKIVGVMGYDKENAREIIFKGGVVIDATEFGDVMYLGGVEYELGVDRQSQEPLHLQSEQCIQPITYVGILKKTNRPEVLNEPEGYDREKFRCVIKNELCPDSKTQFDYERLRTYGKMPGDKLMINIPSHSYGNDFHATAEYLDEYSREEIMEEAKNYSRGFIYFIQSELGMEGYALYNEFGTEDGFAKEPYVRESRRLKGVERLEQNEVMPTELTGRSKFFEDSIAIGDYPIDLHYCDPGTGDIYYYVLPYQIPYWVTVPKKVDGLLVTEKNLSVSHIVNGTTRLQPVVMAVGQAVGAAAALAVEEGVEVREIDVDKLQDVLIESGQILFFYEDLKEGHWAFGAAQKLAMDGVMQGFRDLSFRPHGLVGREEVLDNLELVLGGTEGVVWEGGERVYAAAGARENVLTREELVEVLREGGVVARGKSGEISFEDVEGDLAEDLGVLVRMGVFEDGEKFYPEREVTRAELVVILERLGKIFIINN